MSHNRQENPFNDGWQSKNQTWKIIWCIAIAALIVAFIYLLVAG